MRSSARALIFLPTAFLAAFLLFEVQPLVTKRILPWFGGTPTVWNTCLLFFQVLLLGGYAFAHLSAQRLSFRWQAIVYLVFFSAAAFAAVLPGANWKPPSGVHPAPYIIRMLLVTVGPPFFVLAATSPLIQAWFATAFPGRTPYYLYAVGNGGSLLALLSYPFVVEPALDVTTQAMAWRIGFVTVLALVLVTAWVVRESAQRGGSTKAAVANEPAATSARSLTPGRLRGALWIAWPACGVILFMSVTNQITLNIAAVPLLWVMPLAIYILSFVVAFAGTQWYPRGIFGALLGAVFPVFYVLLPGEVTQEATIIEIATTTKIIVVAVALLIGCTVCHGELYRLRPEPRRLTRYYLSISLGGALGGFCVAIVAPAVFLLFHELQLGLLLAGVLYLLTHFFDPSSRLYKGRPLWAWAGMVVVFATMAGVSFWLTKLQLAGAVETRRNFFGLIRVREFGPESGLTPHRLFYHGSTVHNVQFTEGDLRYYPAGYYGPQTGVWAVFNAYRDPEGRYVGIIGEGAAALAAFGEEKDRFRFYEIDPDVHKVAASQFTYLDDTRAQWDVIFGDARLRLEEEPDQQFDILVLDAFSSDAIPVHLLTLEAMKTYDRHLKSEGVIAIHITNRYLDLAPIVLRMAESWGYQAVLMTNRKREGGLSAEATWVAVSRNEAYLTALIDECAEVRKQGLMSLSRGLPPEYERIRPWADNYSNLFQVLR